MAFVEQLARGVVDRRDVVGVEGVAKAQRVGEDPEADAEVLVVAGHDEGDQDAEAHDVQGDDRHHHQRDLAPFALVEGSLQRLVATLWSRRVP